MNYQSITTRGFSEDANGYSGVFSWFRSDSKPGIWCVVAYELGFSSSGYAVTDDFGNLVRVAA